MSIPLKVKRLRPKRCAVCHVDATYAEITVRSACSIKRNGNIARFNEQHCIYYCDEHTGITR